MYKTKEKPMMHSKIEAILNKYGIKFHYVSDHIIAKSLGDVTYWTEEDLIDRIT